MGKKGGGGVGYQQAWRPPRFPLWVAPVTYRRGHFGLCATVVRLGRYRRHVRVFVFDAELGRQIVVDHRKADLAAAGLHL